MRRARTSEVSNTPSTVSATRLTAGMVSVSALSVSWLMLSRKICMPVFVRVGRIAGLAPAGPTRFSQDTQTRQRLYETATHP